MVFQGPKALGDDGPRVRTQGGSVPKAMLLPYPTSVLRPFYRRENRGSGRRGGLGRDTRLIDNRRSHGLSLYYAEARTPVSDP